MYHGQVVPGFPNHPHRGFETVTFVRKGLIDHADSLGAAARFGRGDVQWVTAGRGIVHSEMFPLLDHERPNPLELFQIWLNLPGRRQAGRPLLHDALGRGHPPPGRPRTTRAAASTSRSSPDGFGGLTPPPPPPSSWASQPESDLAIWHLRLDPGASWTLPPAAGPGHQPGALRLRGRRPPPWPGPRWPTTPAWCCRPTPPSSSPPAPVEVEALLLQGRPIGEPVAQYGPFVMNTQDEIVQAFDDYRETGVRRLAVARRGSPPRSRDRSVRPPRRRPGRGDRAGRHPELTGRAAGGPVPAG